MKRRVFDLVASAGGATVVVILLVAGSLLMWGYSFANNTVHNQLAMQQVYFPTRAEILSAPASSTEIPPVIRPYLLQYAGQEVLSGPQAETYANHFIAEHLSEMPFHGVYSKVSAAAMSAPKGSAAATKLEALESTVFQGTTLRAMLLEAYGRDRSLHRSRVAGSARRVRVLARSSYLVGRRAAGRNGPQGPCGLIRSRRVPKSPIRPTGMHRSGGVASGRPARHHVASRHRSHHRVPSRHRSRGAQRPSPFVEACRECGSLRSSFHPQLGKQVGHVILDGLLR